ncbi:hypothetical protein B1R32_11494 [Abditibacterium utsteinense]|uniref:Acyltransferase 3 domain-containing protein n=1 Tax=Abditibacterium utsteinense TaxID=1960156 RepID=A0A2S8SR64_9BACT|nr:acyltransferase [Abditibacterium utsteinense]PQV63268.1 hypothetical protein B1R32_11494 [Abditibacterium utsteinense]
MKPSSPRYVFVDALRGIASLGVLLAHIINNEISKKTLQALLPRSIQEICFNGQFGVEVFFVLSGFVIALSLSQKPLTFPRAVNFALRRQIRLDPPYFAALLALMGLHAAFGRGFPDLKTLALNFVYAHNLAGVPQILGVAWTLCLEIQFYLAFLAILSLDRVLGKPRDAPFSMLAVHFLWISGVASCVLVQISTPWQLYAFAPGSWFYFAAGVLSFWCWKGLAPQWVFGTIVLGMMGSAFVAFLREASYVSASFQGIEAGLTTALLLFVGGARGWLETVSLGRGVQFLGRISYSLYLTHAFVIEALMWTTRALWGEKNGAMSGFALSVPLALAVAQGFYWLIERPSVNWAARFKN